MMRFNRAVLMQCERATDRHRAVAYTALYICNSCASCGKKKWRGIHGCI